VTQDDRMLSFVFDITMVKAIISPRPRSIYTGRLLPPLSQRAWEPIPDRSTSTTP